MPVIRISNQLFQKLQEEARQMGWVFISPDNLLRGLLGMEQVGKKRADPKCPKCGLPMTIGTAHDDGDQYQWECRCGFIRGVRRKITEE